MSHLLELRKLATEVSDVYHQMGIIFSTFQQKNNLNCLSGCGFCCLNPDIYASILEMLPTVFRIIDNGNASRILEILENNTDLNNSSCLFYHRNSEDGQKGQCTNYQDRPTICRQFGAALRLEKNQQIRPVVCKKIKESSATWQQFMTQSWDETDQENLPIMSYWDSKVHTLSAGFLIERYQINHALLKALKYILWLSHIELEVNNGL
jgi:Fe-S-cluster containining protein